MAAEKSGCVAIFALAMIAIPIIFCCGFLSLGTDREPSGRTSAVKAQSADVVARKTQVNERAFSEQPQSEAEVIFAKRMAEYEALLASWERAVSEREASEAAKAEVVEALARHEGEKPGSPPSHTERQWSTFDKQYTTLATYLDADGENVRLKKQEGGIISVPRARLIAEDRVYINDAVEEESQYQERLQQWTEERNELAAREDALEEKLATASAVRPNEPKLADVVAELKETEIAARRAEEDERLAADAAKRAAAEAARGKSTEEALEAYAAIIRVVDPDALLIDKVQAKDDTVILTVTNYWHVMHYQNRLQAAQNLWAGWAKLKSPREPDRARLSLVDFNGNKVGGSRFLAGSLIWVQED